MTNKKLDPATVEAVTISSDDYRGLTRYGILNADGDFWTPDAFKSEQQAKDAIAAFWNDVTKTREFLTKCSIVPVIVTLSLPTPPEKDKG